MQPSSLVLYILGWMFWLLIFTLGILNMILVHPVPGLIYMALSAVFYPSTNDFLQKKLKRKIPVWMKTVLGVLILWFTLGMSDLMQIFEEWLYR